MRRKGMTWKSIDVCAMKVSRRKAAALRKSKARQHSVKNDTQLERRLDAILVEVIAGRNRSCARKSVSAGNIRYGQRLHRRWSKDQTVIPMSSGEAELYAACMAAQQATGTENMARELGVHLDAMELKVEANAAIGIINKQECGKIETSGSEPLVPAVSCARKAGEPKESTVREQHGRSRDEGAREG